MSQTRAWLSKRVLLLLCGLLPAISGCASAEEQFLQEQVRNLAAADVGVVTINCEAAYEVAAEARHMGIDLFEAYQRNRQDRRLRHSLAYLLILEQSEPYVAFASKNIAEMVDTKEFLLWAAVLMDENVKMQDPFRETMLSLLVPATVSAPYAPFVKMSHAWNLIAKGIYLQGIREMMQVIVSDSPCSWHAYLKLERCLHLLPAPRQAEFLLPYLQTESEEGAFAAAILGQTQDGRQKAMEYLDHLKKSGNSRLVSAVEFAEQRISERAKRDVEEAQ